MVLGTEVSKGKISVGAKGFKKLTEGLVVGFTVFALDAEEKAGVGPEDMDIESFF